MPEGAVPPECDRAAHREATVPASVEIGVGTRIVRREKKFRARTMGPAVTFRASRRHIRA
jgi:hypothetical protein